MSFARRLNAAFVALFVAAAFPPTAHAEVLVLAHDLYPPYVDPDAKHGGIAAEAVRTLLAPQGLDVEIVVMSWREALDGAILGRYDGIVGAWYAEERTPFLAFSEPYMVNRLVLFSSEDAPIDVTDYADLRGTVVGVIDGYVYPSDFMTSSLFTRAVEADNSLNLLKLVRGRVDFIVDDERVGWRLAGRLEAAGRMGGVRLRTHPLVVAEHGMRIAISRKRGDHDHIIAGVNAALAQSVLDR